LENELLKLREFATAFREWQREMNNVSFRALLAKLGEAERAAPILITTYQKREVVMGQNWWIFKDGRTCPGKYHRTGGDGLLVGTVEILREGDVDKSGHDAVEFQKVTPTHLDYLLAERILSDSPGWREALWGPNGEWMGPHGVLYVWEDEHPADVIDNIFAAFEAVRTGPPIGKSPETVQVLGAPEPALPSGGNVVGSPATKPSAPDSADAGAFDPRDKNKDGVVDKHERKDARHHES
jgi:hypothetical protein